MNPNQSPRKSNNGKTIQPKNIKAPAKTMEISIKKPVKIKKARKIAPIILDIILKTKASKYLPRLNPFP